MNTEKPWQQLSHDQQSTAIDLAVAMSLVITRLPGISQHIFDLVLREYAAQYDVSLNIARYALRSCGEALFQTSWSCTVDKDSQNMLATHFKQESSSLPGDNGENGHSP